MTRTDAAAACVVVELTVVEVDSDVDVDVDVRVEVDVVVEVEVDVDVGVEVDVVGDSIADDDETVSSTEVGGAGGVQVAVASGLPFGGGSLGLPAPCGSNRQPSTTSLRTPQLAGPMFWYCQPAPVPCQYDQ